MSLKDDIENNVPQNKIEAKETSQVTRLTEKQIETMSQTVASGYGFSEPIEGFDIICLCMQKGGVNTKQGGGRSKRNKVNIPFVYGGKEISTAQVNGYILNQLPNVKIRQVARALGTSIAKRSKLYEEPGFILKQLEELYPEKWAAIDHPDKEYWATDFQHQNPDCPEAIRDLLKLRYQDRYRPLNQRSYNLNKDS
jgi:hypothetical protein